jgi:integrative and conjugative element protein (TIGR02256 family)
MTRRDREYWSADRRFGLRISDTEVQKLVRFCNGAGENETGGILVGFYSANHDCAIITDLCGPPSDSQFGRTWFWRGVRGLQRWLRELWPRRRFYLGEWHFHPCSRAAPSQVDCDQLNEIARSEKYHCPEPILLLIGGTPPSDREMAVYVFPREQACVPLEERTPDI